MYFPAPVRTTGQRLGYATSSVAITLTFVLCWRFGVIVGVVSWPPVPFDWNTRPGENAVVQLARTPPGLVPRNTEIRAPDWHLLHKEDRTNGISERRCKWYSMRGHVWLVELRVPAWIRQGFPGNLKTGTVFLRLTFCGFLRA